MITESARDVLVVIYAPSGVPDASLESAMARLSERFSLFAAAAATRTAITKAAGPA